MVFHILPDRSKDSWKSAKWAGDIELISTEKPGFWEQNRYHIRGDPSKEKRYS